jgi:hypothetical protein
MFLINNKLENKSFLANEIIIPKRGNIIKNFIYKHSNKDYKYIWTIYFNRIENTSPKKFSLDHKILVEYEKKFNLNLKNFNI